MVNTSPGAAGEAGPAAHQPARHHPSPIVMAVVAEAVAVALSLGANLAEGWRHGVVAIVAAGATPVVLTLGVYLFLAHRVPVAWSPPRRARAARTAGRFRAARPARPARAGAAGWSAWWANLASAVAILGPVAIASYWHQRELLGANGSPVWLATILPLAVDGLAVRAALTLWLAPTAASTAALEAPTATATATPPAEDLEDDAELDDTAPPALPAVTGVDPDVVAAARTLLEGDPGLGRPTLRARLVELGHPRLSDHACKGVLAALRPVRVVEGVTA